MHSPARSVSHLVILAALAAWVLAACAPAATPPSQTLPSGPVAAYRAALDVAQPPEQFDLVQLTLDFAPGAFTPLHTHGGQGYITVVAGEITVREKGIEKRYKAGESWAETAGDFHEAGNASTTVARVLASFLLPKGASLTTVQQASGTQQVQVPPGPTTVARADLPVTKSPGALQIVHVVQDFAPGAATPLHTHGGDGVVTVVEGTLAVKEEKAEEKRFKLGEFWMEHSGDYAVVSNPGESRSRTHVTFLLPKGATLTINK
jgi:quercetin dioxygenase-like cupin family protein